MDLRYREEVLLDEDEEAQGHSYFDLGSFKAGSCYPGCPWVTAGILKKKAAGWTCIAMLRLVWRLSGPALPTLLSHCNTHASMCKSLPGTVDLGKEWEQRHASSPLVLQVSPDHKHVAYAVDTSGNESYAIYVRNIAARSEVLVNPAVDASASMAWAGDSRTLFYASVVRALHLLSQMAAHTRRFAQ